MAFNRIDGMLPPVILGLNSVNFLGLSRMMKGQGEGVTVATPPPCSGHSCNTSRFTK